jgi:DNA-3-methyladenine glycosylase II
VSRAAFVIEPQGPFDLRLAAGFGFGPDEGRRDADEAVMRLAFLADDLAHHAGVVLTQDAEGRVHGTAETDGDLDAVRAQVARVLSLDHDGRPFVEAGERDPVLGAIQQRYPGLRPVLFHSPYEAAAWSVLSARTQHAQAVRLRDALSEGGIFAAPEQLLQLRELQGLPANKVPRLHGIAQAALEGKLDREPLLAADTNDAFTQLLELPGIGPFYAGLILLRGVGTVDVAPKGEPRLERAVQERYGAPLEAVAGRGKPFRTWVAVLMRSSA